MKPLSAFSFALICACTAACAGAKPAPGPATSLNAQRLYPLRQGSVWSYDVDTGQGGPPTLAITRVTASEGPRSEVSSGGDPIVYEQRPEGLFRPDRAAFVLRNPIRPGEQWDAGNGAKAEVVAVDLHVATPAGEFSGCVEVRESGGETGKLVRTVFCPDVGPVEVESSLQLALSGDVARVVARLRGYDFSGALQ